MTAPALPAAEVALTGASEEEWLEEKKNGIGGSEIAGVLGISRWQSPLSLYMEKARIVAPEVVESDAMRWGKILERPVREEFSSHEGVATFAPPLYTLYRSKTLPAALASPDGLAFKFHGFMPGDVLLGNPPSDPDITGWYEGKVTFRRGEDWSDDYGKPIVPLAYEAQCQWELAVSGLPVCYVAALLPGPRFLTFTVEADPTVQADMLQAAENFWHLVETRQMPEADGHAATTDALKSAYGHAVLEDEVELAPHFLYLNVRGRELKAARKELDEDIAEIDNRFRAAMGHHAVATVGGVKVASAPLIPGGHRDFAVEPYRRITLTAPKKEKR